MDTSQPVRRRLMIAASTIVLMLVVVVAFGWVVRGPSSGDTTSPRELPGTLPAEQLPAEQLPAEQPPATTTPAPARLDLLIKSRVKGGILTLFVDGKRVYDKNLAKGSRKSNQSDNVTSRDNEEISARIDIAAGEHTLMARFVPASGSTKVEQSVKFEIEANATRDLAIVVGRGIFGRRLALTLE